jgi:hypothetical protein
VSKTRPTDKSKAQWEAAYRDTLRSRPRSLLRSHTVKSNRQAKRPPGCSLPRRAPRSRPRSLPRSRPPKSTKSTQILLKPPIESATMKSTGWTPTRTSKDNCVVQQHLRVNTTPGCEIYSTNHCTKAQESAGTLELGKYNHFRETYVLDIDE